MKSPIRYIIIDDDPVNILLCRMIIKSVWGKVNIQTFEVPETGFEYIKTEYTKNKDEVPTVLFLDINMPSWTGWEFLENFEMLDEKIKMQIKIYLLTSS